MKARLLIVAAAGLSGGVASYVMFHNDLPRKVETNRLVNESQGERLDGHDGELSQHGQTIGENKNSIETLGAETRAAKKEIAEARKQLEHLEKEIVSAGNDRSALRDELLKLEGRIASLRVENTRRDQEIQALLEEEKRQGAINTEFDRRLRSLEKGNRGANQGDAIVP